MPTGPRERVPVAKGRRRRSFAATLIGLAAIAAMLGIGIIAFTSPHSPGFWLTLANQGH
jgi:hypothetical protein